MTAVCRNSVCSQTPDSAERNAEPESAAVTAQRGVTGDLLLDWRIHSATVIYFPPLSAVGRTSLFQPGSIVNYAHCVISREEFVNDSPWRFRTKTFAGWVCKSNHNT